MYKVMLVDDWEIFRMQFNRKAHWQKQTDFELVCEASNGQEAIDYIKAHEVDCVITDIRMPVMDGVELLQHIRSIDKDMPVVFLSEYEDFHYAKSAITHRIVDYVVKPVNERDIDQLFKKLKEELDQKSAEKIDMTVSYDDLIPLMVEAIIYPEQITKLTETYIQRVKSAHAGHSMYQYVSCLRTLDDALCGSYPWLKNYRLSSPICLLNQADGKTEDSEHLFREAVDLLSQPFNCLYRSSPSQPLIAKVSDMILSHPGHRTIKSLAEALFMNKNYLADVFKKETGQTLNEYMKVIAVFRAKVLARKTDMKNYEIAETLGFQHPDYFCRLFKKCTGETLSAYRKKNNWSLYR